MIINLPAAAAANPHFKSIGTRPRAARHTRPDTFTPAAIGNLAAGTKHKKRQPPRQKKKGATYVVSKKLKSKRHVDHPM
jgi:hypothetical protein